MLQIFINDLQAYLYKDIKIETILNNPLIVTDNESASYPIRIPLSSNYHIFGPIDRSTKNEVKNYYASVRFSSFEIITGLAEISEVDTGEDFVELYVKTSSKSFYGLFGNRYLDEFSSLGEFNIPSTLPFLCYNTYLKGASETNFVFPPIYDQNDIFVPLIPKINRFDPLTGFPAVSLPANSNSICPCLYLHNAIRMIFDAAGYTCSYDNLSNIEGFDSVIMPVANSNNIYDIGHTGTLSYKYMYPHLTVKSFLQEWTKKFSIFFMIDDISKTVNIVCTVDHSTAQLNNLSDFAIDGFKKSSENVDVPLNRKFVDDKVKKAIESENYDATLSELRGKLSIDTVNAENDTTEIECLSSIMASIEMYYQLIWPVQWVADKRYWLEGNTSTDPRVKINVPFNMLTYNSEFLNNQDLRLAIYQKPSTRMYNFNELVYTPDLASWPDLSANWEPISDSDYRPQIFRFPGATYLVDSFNLLWTDENFIDGLYSRYHKTIVEQMDGFTQFHEYTLLPDLTKLQLIKGLNNLNFVIRGQRYVVKKQTITFTLNRIEDWKVQGNPL